MLAFDNIRAEALYDSSYPSFELGHIEAKLFVSHILECPGMSIVARVRVWNNQRKGIEFDITSFNRKFPDMVHLRVTAASFPN
jgi:hypothetical protein